MPCDFVNKLSGHEILVVEALGAAVIDTACTRTVCGEQWLSHCRSCLSDCDKNRVSISPSEKRFKYGDGKEVFSFQRAVIPAKIGQTGCNIDTEVVKSEIPLLLSKASLKSAGAVLRPLS